MTLVNTIRVLVVDDSFFMRKLLQELIQTFVDVEVVGEAKYGAEAISQCLLLQPDVITMDYHMPDMNGAEVTRKIMSLTLSKKPAIIMVSAFTKDGMSETMECLRAGAFDYIQKPSGELSLDIEKIRDEIELKIRVASKSKVVQFSSSQVASVKKPIQYPSPAQKLVIIGSSTGGPPVVEDILSRLPVKLNAAVLVVQHMPRQFTNSFAKRLDGICPHHVKEAQHDDILRSDTILVAPGDADTRIESDNGHFIVKVSDAQGLQGIHPSINVAMESAAMVYQQTIVGVVLSGMGDDGKQGAAKVKSIGGKIIVQDPDTAVVNSMPKTIQDAGYADFILKPEDIPDTIVQLCS